MSFAQTNKEISYIEAHFGVSGIACIPASDLAPQGWGRGDPTSASYIPPLGVPGADEPDVLLNGYEDQQTKLPVLKVKRHIKREGVFRRQMGVYTHELSRGVFFRTEGASITRRGRLVGVVPAPGGSVICDIKRYTTEEGKERVWAVLTNSLDSRLYSYTAPYSPSRIPDDFWVQEGVYALGSLPAISLAPDQGTMQRRFRRASINASATKVAVAIVGVEFWFGEKAQTSGYLVFDSKTLSNPEIVWNPTIPGYGWADYEHEGSGSYSKALVFDVAFYEDTLKLAYFIDTFSYTRSYFADKQESNNGTSGSYSEELNTSTTIQRSISYYFPFLKDPITTTYSASSKVEQRRAGSWEIVVGTYTNGRSEYLDRFEGGESYRINEIFYADLLDKVVVYGEDVYSYFASSDHTAFSAHTLLNITIEGPVYWQRGNTNVTRNLSYGPFSKVVRLITPRSAKDITSPYAASGGTRSWAYSFVYDSEANIYEEEGSMEGLDPFWPWFQLAHKAGSNASEHFILSKSEHSPLFPQREANPFKFIGIWVEGLGNKDILDYRGQYSVDYWQVTLGRYTDFGWLLNYDTYLGRVFHSTPKLYAWWIPEYVFALKNRYWPRWVGQDPPDEPTVHIFEFEQADIAAVTEVVGANPRFLEICKY